MSNIRGWSITARRLLSIVLARPNAVTPLPLPCAALAGAIEGRLTTVPSS